MYGSIRLFSGTSCLALSEEIARCFNLSLSGRDVFQFPNENIFVRLHESVRGQDVFLIQTTSPPVNCNIMEMLIFLDTLKRASAGRITVVIPCLSYGRSDKKDQPRVPITARLLADLIGVAGADRYITLDVHKPQIQGFLSIPGDVLTAFPLIADHFRNKQLHRAVVVSPDLGFVKDARDLAAELDLPVAIVEKRRIEVDTEALTLIGDVDGHDVILVDGEIVTGNTIIDAINLVRESGACDIYLGFAHALLTDRAIRRLGELSIKEIVMTDSVPTQLDKALPNVTVISVASLLGEVIKRVHEGRSVGEMFQQYSHYR